MEQNSPIIQDISEVLSRHCEGLVLVSFYETLPVRLSITKLIVRVFRLVHFPTQLLILPFARRSWRKNLPFWAIRTRCQRLCMRITYLGANIEINRIPNFVKVRGS